MCLLDVSILLECFFGIYICEYGLYMNLLPVKLEFCGHDRLSLRRSIKAKKSITVNGFSCRYLSM